MRILTIFLWSRKLDYENTYNFSLVENAQRNNKRYSIDIDIPCIYLCYIHWLTWRDRRPPWRRRGPARPRRGRPGRRRATSAPSAPEAQRSPTTKTSIEGKSIQLPLSKPTFTTLLWFWLMGRALKDGQKNDVIDFDTNIVKQYQCKYWWHIYLWQ